MLPSASEHTPAGWPKLCPVRTPREPRGWWALPNSCTSPNSSLTAKPPSGPGPTQKRHGGWSKGLPGWSEREAVHISRQVVRHQEVAKSIHSQPLGGQERAYSHPAALGFPGSVLESLHSPVDEVTDHHKPCSCHGHILWDKGSSSRNAAG